MNDPGPEAEKDLLRKDGIECEVRISTERAPRVSKSLRIPTHALGEILSGARGAPKGTNLRTVEKAPAIV